ncbi:MAG: hypothetical protein QOJ73_7252 [Streptosporangiaceae bacterium]|nr:hypothetical protein [Streptosporangiaceae bacterium]
MKPSVRGQEVGGRLRQLRTGLYLTVEFHEKALPGVVFVEGPYVNLRKERPAEVERRREAIEYLRYESLPPWDSLHLIADISERVRHLTGRLVGMPDISDKEENSQWHCQIHQTEGTFRGASHGTAMAERASEWRPRVK